MSRLLADLGRLSAAEEFLDYLGVAYDPAVVHVNRLHILKRFHQYLSAARDALAAMEEESLREAYRTLLERAYQDFVRSSAREEKVFKVFQTAPQVSLDRLRESLPSRGGR